MRVVVLSHGHPTFNKGGAEYAAYHLFQALQQQSGTEAWFVARGDAANLHLGSHVAMLAEREYLVSGQAGVEELSATMPLDEDSDFATLLRTLDPDVLHFHHYYLLGLETLRVARRACPRARVILTLHDYMGICANHGQMVKTGGGLCYRASPRECAQCFPGRSPEDFFLRERYVKAHFELVDAFVAPSRFLAGRYTEWGLPRERMHVIENLLPSFERLAPRRLAPGEGRGRFAYFGQINPFKGVDVLIEAFARLPGEVQRQVSLEVYGTALENQKPEFRARIAELVQATDGAVVLLGAYELRELPQLMAEVDWVLMGSVWWENSPLVIQEAHALGRPVICPGIGGMAEKLAGDKGGFSYRPGDAVALARLVAQLRADVAGYAQVVERLPRPIAPVDSLRAHVELYRGA
jgi:glycosyltransferase involved in cell wall biosynthesis